jgi:periplasmic protein TonB
MSIAPHLPLPSPRVAFAALFALVLLAPPARAQSSAGPVVAVVEAADGTVAPRLLNAGRIAQAVVARYPGWVEMAGTREVQLLVEVDASGRVRSVRIEESSGSALADRALSDAAREMRFEPAQLGGEAVPVWVRVPLVLNQG